MNIAPDSPPRNLQGIEAELQDLRRQIAAAESAGQPTGALRARLDAVGAQRINWGEIQRKNGYSDGQMAYIRSVAAGLTVKNLSGDHVRSQRPERRVVRRESGRRPTPVRAAAPATTTATQTSTRVDVDVDDGGDGDPPSSSSDDDPDIAAAAWGSP